MNYLNFFVRIASNGFCTYRSGKIKLNYLIQVLDFDYIENVVSSSKFSQVKYSVIKMRNKQLKTNDLKRSYTLKIKLKNYANVFSF